MNHSMPTTHHLYVGPGRPNGPAGPDKPSGPAGPAGSSGPGREVEAGAESSERTKGTSRGSRPDEGPGVRQRPARETSTVPGSAGRGQDVRINSGRCHVRGASQWAHGIAPRPKPPEGATLFTGKGVSPPPWA